MYIDFIQCSNYWIKINFDSKWTLSSKMLLCKFLSFLLMLIITKRCHQDFNLLCTTILVIHHFLSEKWLTLNVISPQEWLPWYLWPNVIDNLNCEYNICFYFYFGTSSKMNDMFMFFIHTFWNLNIHIMCTLFNFVAIFIKQIDEFILKKKS